MVLFCCWTSISIYGYDKTENLLENGDFANGLEGWETKVSSTPNYTKIWTEDGICYFSAGSSISDSYYNCQIYQILKLQPGKYKCSFNFIGSLSYWGGSKVFFILASEDDSFDTSWSTNDDLLIHEAKDNDEYFKSEYFFTINKESYVMYSLSVNACYANTVISNCKLTRESIFLEPQAKSLEKEYGEINPKFEIGFNGVIAGDESLIADNIHASFECDANAFSDVGEYPIRLTCTGFVDGYEIKKCSNGILTVKQAVINVYCNDIERVYGEPNPEPTIIYTGFKNGEDINVLTTLASYKVNATPFSDVGEYSIELSGANSLNYNFVYESAKLTINKALLSGKIKDCARTYGDENPTFTIKFIGLKNNEVTPIWINQPDYKTEADRFSDVGVYSVSASHYEAKNYRLEKIEEGSLTITPRNLILKVNDAEKLYCQDNPLFSYSSVGFVNGDDTSIFLKNPEFSTEATKLSNVGSYEIKISGAEALNYNINYNSGILIINKRLLTIVADDKTKCYNAENPVFTYSIDGFVNNENEEVLLERPYVHTNATKTSDCGIYVIDVDGGEALNYEFNYVAGKLVITKIDQNIIWNQSFGNIYVGDQIELQAISDSGLPVDYIVTGNVEEYKSGDKTFIDCMGSGNVTIRAIQEGDINYNPAKRVVKSFVISDEASIENVNSECHDLDIHIEDGYLLNQSSSDRCIEIYNISGQCIYRGSEDKIFIGEGIFIIRINGRTLKLISQ